MTTYTNRDIPTSSEYTSRTDRSFILREDSFFILREDGTKFLREDSYDINTQYTNRIIP